MRRLEGYMVGVGIGLLIIVAIGSIQILFATGCEPIVEPTFAGPARWGSTPVGISTAPDFDWDRELTTAVSAWNSAAGCTVFELAPDGPVHVSIGSVHETRKGWTEVSAVNDVITRAEVSVHGVAETGQAYVVLLHELGHALMLEHDPQKTSAMHENVAEMDPVHVRITHKDGQALAAAYCK